MTKRAVAAFALCLSLVIAPMLSRTSVAATTDATKSGSAKTPGSATAPSDKEIADAKAKGMVWLNTSSGVYHKEGRYYGKTKQGKFMTEGDAKKAGYREAKSEAGAKTDSKATTKKP